MAVDDESVFDALGHNMHLCPGMSGGSAVFSRIVQKWKGPKDLKVIMIMHNFAVVT